MDNSLYKLVFKPVEDIAKAIGFNTEQTLIGIIANLISVFLSLLGIIFLVLTIYGGFVYMLARGQEAEVKKALQIIKNAVIGLLLVLSSYSIAYFVTNAVSNAALK